MLRSQQEEQIKYFYLDRKFGSGNLGQIGDALNEIDLYLPHMKKIDLINSLIMRMLDLIQTAKSFHVKERVAHIFRHHARILLGIHSKDEIAAVLAKCLKGSDQYTRIVTIQMVATLPALFLKDIAVYHTLLSKISFLNTLSRQEKKEAIICLTELLTASRQLSKLFSKNVSEIQQQYKIPLHILIYLLTHVTIDSHMQIQIIEKVLALITNYNNSELLSSRQVRKETYYFQKLVINYASINYRVVQFYQAKLKDTLPKVEKEIMRIKSKKYSFMKNVEEPLNDPSCMTTEELIDELYELKKEGEKLQKYQILILTLLTEFIRSPNNFKDRILLFYFLQTDVSKLDKQFSIFFTKNVQFSTSKLLKQSLSVGLFHTSRVLMQQIQMNQSSYIFFKTYIQFKLSDSLQGLLDFHEIISILSPTFSVLLDSWSLINDLLNLKERRQFSLQKYSAIYCNLNEKLQQLKKSTIFPLKQEIQILTIFLNFKQSSISELKSKCYHIIPSNMLDNRRFWFAYLGKQTILALFNNRLL